MRSFSQINRGLTNEETKNLKKAQKVQVEYLLHKKAVTVDFDI